MVRSAERSTEETYSAHPLDTAGVDGTRMTRRVLVFARTLSHVGDRSLSAMRVIWEALQQQRVYASVRWISDMEERREAYAPHPCQCGSGRA